MNCEELIRVLVDYVEGSLTEEELQAIASHLALCDGCVVYLRTYEITIRLEKVTARIDRGDVPEELVQAVLAARDGRDL